VKDCGKEQQRLTADDPNSNKYQLRGGSGGRRLKQKLPPQQYKQINMPGGGGGGPRSRMGSGFNAPNLEFGGAGSGVRGPEQTVYGPVCDVHAVGNGVRAGHIIRGSLVLLQQALFCCNKR